MGRVQSRSQSRNVKTLLAAAVVIMVVTMVWGWYGSTAHEEEAAPIPDHQARLFRDMGVMVEPFLESPVELSLPDPGGNTVAVSDFRGKIVLVVFWATWCPTCRDEMPSLERLHRRFIGEDLAVLAVNLKESAGKVSAFVKKHDLTFTMLLDRKGSYGSAFAIRSIPTAFIVDKKGGVAGRITGPREWDQKEAFVLFEYLVNL